MSGLHGSPGPEGWIELSDVRIIQEVHDLASIYMLCSNLNMTDTEADSISPHSVIDSLISISPVSILDHHWPPPNDIRLVTSMY